MRDATRVCKSGCKWTQNDLTAFNIKVVVRLEKEFFGLSLDDVSLNNIPKGLVDLEWPSVEDSESYDILRYLDLAMSIKESEESAVDDFASRLLEILMFKKPGQLIRTRKDIKMIMCGKLTHAKADVCIVDEEGILLLLQEDKSHINLSDPEPQVIAEAIAAFQHNNEIRTRFLGLESLEEYLFPCITMVGTYPTFYKVRVTKHLDEAVRFGSYPEVNTTVDRFNPIADLSAYSYGMKPLRYRKIILQSFIAFRDAVCL